MLKRLSAILLLLCWLPSVATATEYVITEPQLTRLENNLITLKTSNTKLQMDLAMLREQSKNQEELLMNVNQSFEQYAASQKAKLRKTKAERNALLIILGGAVVALIAKR